MGEGRIAEWIWEDQITIRPQFFAPNSPRQTALIKCLTLGSGQRGKEQVRLAPQKPRKAGRDSTRNALVNRLVQFLHFPIDRALMVSRQDDDGYPSKNNDNTPDLNQSLEPSVNGPELHFQRYSNSCRRPDTITQVANRSTRSIKTQNANSLISTFICDTYLCCPVFHPFRSSNRLTLPAQPPIRLSDPLYHHPHL